MKNLIQNLLISFAKKIIAVQKPTVIAITGSVGKTSTRNAIAAVLEGSVRVRTNYANYNNEFGVPLTIVDEVSPGKDPAGWFKVLVKAWKLSKKVDPDFPQVLVLEYGADAPGDITALCDIAEPDIGVLTAISPVHAEGFGTIEELAKEKAVIIERAKVLAVMNGDDERVMKQKRKAGAEVVTYGLGDALVQAKNIRIEAREDFSFEPGEQFAETHFDIAANGEELPATLPNLIGRAQVSAAIAATAVGLSYGMALSEIIPRLAAIPPQAGRMRPIAGIKGSLILDDSYNAAPASVEAALEVLGKFKPYEGARRIAALGTMAELGQYSENEHRMIGMSAAAHVDLLVTVGIEAKIMHDACMEAGAEQHQCYHFASSEEAGRFLDKEVRKGDIVLVKGSQSTRMEKVVKDLMAEPLKAKDLLVRQSDKWLNE